MTSSSTPQPTAPPAEVCRHCGWLKEHHDAVTRRCPAVSELRSTFAPAHVRPFTLTAETAL